MDIKIHRINSTSAQSVLNGIENGPVVIYSKSNISNVEYSR